MSVELAKEFLPPVCVYTFYKIICKDELLNICYIGKTKDFKNRISNHKTNSKNSEVKLYKRKRGLYEENFAFRSSSWFAFSKHWFCICVWK